METKHGKKKKKKKKKSQEVPLDICRLEWI